MKYAGMNIIRTWNIVLNVEKKNYAKKPCKKTSKKKLDEIAETFKYVDRDILPNDYLGILERRLAGETLGEIGEAYGVSRQAIQQKLKRIESGDIPFVNTKAKLKRKIARLEKELEKFNDTQEHE